MNDNSQQENSKFERSKYEGSNPRAKSIQEIEESIRSILDSHSPKNSHRNTRKINDKLKEEKLRESKKMF